MTEPNKIPVTADIIVFSESGGHETVMLIQRKNEPYKGQWCLPGGFVDDGELVLSAAYRELKEETGLVVDRLSFVGYYDEPGRDPRGRTVSFVFALRVPSLMGRAWAGDDAEALIHCSIDLLADMELGFDHKRMITDALNMDHIERFLL